MATPPLDRKPLAAMQSLQGWTIRYAPCERAAITDAARARGFDPSSYARDLSLMGLTLVESPTLMEAYIRETAVLRAPYRLAPYRSASPAKAAETSEPGS